MTKREHVIAAIEHRETDRVPSFIRFCSDGWQNVAPYAEGIGRQEFVGNYVAEVYPPWWHWYGLGPDWRGHDAPKSISKVRGSGSYADFDAHVKRLADTSELYILVMIYGSHFEKANSARGIENFLADMAGSPDFARKLLTRIIDKNMVMLENILSYDEIDGILLGSDWGSQIGLLMSPEVWDDMIRPGEQREYDLIKAYGKHIWIHSCGDIHVLIPRLIEMGIDVLNPVQPECMDIARLKSDFGDRLTFWGGIGTQRILPYGTPEEVKAEARRVRDLMSRGGGYILAPSQDIQGDVPAENILALLEVAREPRPSFKEECK